MYLNILVQAYINFLSYIRTKDKSYNFTLKLYGDVDSIKEYIDNVFLRDARIENKYKSLFKNYHTIRIYNK